MGARVIMIAATVLRRENWNSTPYVEHPFPSDIETVLSADELAEFAGRVHRNDWARPRAATNAGYLVTLFESRSAELEHASASFYIDGISTSAAHTFTADAGLSCTLRLQRRIVLNDATFVVPPAVRDDDDIADHFERSVELFHDLAAFLESKGVSREAAREAARTVLPNGTEAALLVTGSMAVWRDVVAWLGTCDEDEELRALSELLLDQLVDVAPNTFQDLMPQRWLALDNPGGGSTRVTPMVTGYRLR